MTEAGANDDGESLTPPLSGSLIRYTVLTERLGGAPMDDQQSRTKIRNYAAVAEEPALEPAAARAALEKALASIPDEELRNFRGGQILIVM
ncbi:hypothetical protein [Nocardia tenerifensis]|nr:hypothetical protein [Nocardia tenerifensis]